MEHNPLWEANRPSFSQDFPMFCGTQRFITTSTNTCHLSLSWPRTIQSMSPHPISCKSTLILSSHLSLFLPSGSIPRVFSLKPCIQLSCSPFVPHALTILFLTWSPEYYLVTSTEQKGPWLTTYKINILVVWNQNTFIFCIWLIYLSVSVNVSTSFFASVCELYILFVVSLPLITFMYKTLF